jgi:hypothetical protein
MKLRNRFLLVGTGVVLFLVTTPVLVLYARGFKIDWKTKSVVKTGTLVVKTEPEEAIVFLNDQKQDSETPSNIRFLIPGDYNIRIEKTDYQSWTKRLSVRSQLVTWANSNRDYIALFLKMPALHETWIGQDVFIIEHKIYFHTATNQVREINTKNGEISSLETDPSPSIDPIPEINATLNQLNTPVPSFTSGFILKTSNQIYLILDQTLYLVNDHLEKIYSPVTKVDWDENSKELLFSNNNEIYLYNADYKTFDLIMRSLTPLNNPVLNIETGYVFFQNEGKIKAIEIDGRDHHNIFTIADALDNFSLSTDGKKLFVFNQTEIKEYRIR